MSKIYILTNTETHRQTLHYDKVEALSILESLQKQGVQMILTSYVIDVDQLKEETEEKTEQKPKSLKKKQKKGSMDQWLEMYIARQKRLAI